MESRLQYVRFPDILFVTFSLILRGNAQDMDKTVENFVIKSVKLSAVKVIAVCTAIRIGSEHGRRRTATL